MSRPEHSDRMCFSAADFFDLMILQILNHLWLRLIRAAIFVLWHALGIWVAQLTAAATAPGVESAFLRKGDGVCIAARNLDDLDTLQELYESGCWLIRVALNICRQVTH